LREPEQFETVTNAKPAPSKRASEKRRPDLDSMYCINEDGSRNMIHPADVKGRFQVRKKLLWALLVAIYSILPWIQIGGHPAVLIDLPRRHFYLFGGVFNASDFYMFFFFVGGFGLSLILFSALFGRIWCGYGCPQTVFMEGFFRRVERWIDGPAGKRQKQGGRVWRAILKQVCFLGLSLVISHIFLSYFIPVDELRQVVTSAPSEHWTAFMFVMVFTGIIYGNFARFREQTCLILCPYGRLQSVLSDPDTVNVQYDFARGEPRGHYNEEGAGDCIDCYRCVAVCPTGIDIRAGVQMECIGCANCIDACEEVMDKARRPRGLIRYASQREIEEGKARFWRPRLFLYTAIFLCFIAGFILLSLQRNSFDARLIRQRGVPYSLDREKGLVRNGFRIHLVNKLGHEEHFVLEGLSPEKAKFIIPNSDVLLKPTESRNVTLFVEMARKDYKPGMIFRMKVQVGDKSSVVEARFLGPN
jgi:cytochrome c oxidase accessory protein FixG